MDQTLDQPNRAAALEAEADAAAGRGDAAAARALLAQATAADPGRGEAWLKLAAMCRAEGDLAAALAAVSGALQGRSARLRAAAAEGQSARKARPGGGSRRDLWLCAGAGAGRSAAAPRRDGRPRARAARGACRGRRARGLPRRRAGSRFRESRAGAGWRASRSNVLRRTRPYHSEPTHFHYPGLREREFHDRALFPWLAGAGGGDRRRSPRISTG